MKYILDNTNMKNCKVIYDTGHGHVSFKDTKKEIELEALNKEKFERLIRDSFQFKRKTLRNNLRVYPLEKIEKVLKKYGHDLSTRAEAIPVLEFVEISNCLE